MVIAPHPDDEALATSAVILQARQAGKNVKVVIATNGDCEVHDIARVREQETVAAMALLGLTPDDVIFLGYADCGLRELYYYYTTPAAQFTSAAGFNRTYAHEGFRRTDFHTAMFGTSAPYSGHSLRLDLTALLRYFKPQDIYVTSAYDENLDHYALNFLVSEAVVPLLRTDPTFQPTLHDVLVHEPCELCDPSYQWPMPTFTPDQPFPMPALIGTTPLAWADRESTAVPAQMGDPVAATNLKSRVLRQYASQSGSSPWFQAFVKSDEIAWKWELWANRALHATATASSNVTPGTAPDRVNDGVAVGSPRVPLSRGGRGEWVSNATLAGAWVQLTWAGPQPITRVVLHDRPDGTENVTAGTLTFSDGSSLPVGVLPTGGAGLTVVFAQKNVTWVRFTVTAATGTAAGLSELEVYGPAGAKQHWQPPAPNMPPVITHGPTAMPASLTDAQTATLSVAAADGNGDALSYVWSASSGHIQGSGATVTFVPPTVLSPTSVRIDVWVSDGRLGTTTSNVTVTVAPSGQAVNIAGLAVATASSENVDHGQVAGKAIDGNIDGYPTNAQAEWTTQGELAGAWIQLTWNTPVTISRSVLHDRINPIDRVLGGTLHFSDGSTVPVGPLPNDGAGLVTDFAPRAVTWARLEVTNASGGSVGLAEWQVVTAATSGGDDVAVDFGPYGLWLGTNAGGGRPSWTHLHGLSPTRLLVADIDDDGRDEIVAGFQNHGVWVWRLNGGWVPLHGMDVAALAVGDFDGNGHPDLALSFVGAGLWLRMNGTSWTNIHGLTATGLAVGNVDGDAGGRDDLVVDFGDPGVWTWTNHATWLMVHPFNPTDLAVADVDGNGQADVVLDFAGYGVWTRMNGASWVQRHGMSTTGMIATNVDGDSGHRADLILNFPGYGVWGLFNGSTWRQIHPQNATWLSVTNVDGNGANVIMSFPSAGTWIWRNDSTWTYLHALNLEGASSGRLSGP